MNRPEREAAARQLMERTPAPVPPDLYGEVVRRGTRILRRRRLARALLWVLLCAAAVAFTVWAVQARPWAEPPSGTTPPVTSW
ncbi:hypothetical protein ACGFYV_27845 [Streptomyces sp. NPDC048297]|uniref:hypothetical protein n=1 Tax=Streptomyces sp. NPDC048297 TaxID=3365531 RepID=UPI00371A0B3A